MRPCEHWSVNAHTARPRRRRVARCDRRAARKDLARARRVSASSTSVTSAARMTSPLEPRVQRRRRSIERGPPARRSVPRLRLLQPLHLGHKGRDVAAGTIALRRPSCALDGRQLAMEARRRPARIRSSRAARPWPSRSCGRSRRGRAASSSIAIEQHLVGGALGSSKAVGADARRPPLEGRTAVEVRARAPVAPTPDAGLPRRRRRPRSRSAETATRCRSRPARRACRGAARRTGRGRR